MDSTLQQVLREQGVAESDIEREITDPVNFRGLLKVIPPVTREGAGLPPAYSSPRPQSSPASRRVSFRRPGPEDAGPSRLPAVREIVESAVVESVDEDEDEDMDEDDGEEEE